MTDSHETPVASKVLATKPIRQHVVFAGESADNCSCFDVSHLCRVDPLMYPLTREIQPKSTRCQSKVEVKSLEKQGFAKCCQSVIQACLDYGTEGPRTIGSGKEEGSAVLGAAAFRGEQKLIAIKRDDRRRHVAIIGKTGMGNTTLLRKLVSSDMTAGRGVGLVDPHGDLAEDVLRAVPKRRTNDVVLLDAGDREFPPAFNPFDCGQGRDRALVASGIVTGFKKLYGDSWGPRLEHILRNAVLALLEVRGSTLLSLQRMLSDARYRKRLVEQVSDPLVRSFWMEEFAAKPARFQEEATTPLSVMWATLNAKLSGHDQYYGINDNWPWLMKFRGLAKWLAYR